MQKVFIKSYGCQMNVYDAQRMADALAPDGYVETGDINEAQLVVLNTCHIREKAADRIYSTLGRIRRMKKARAADGETMQVVVAGCVAQAEGKEILRREEAVDLVIGPQNYHRLPDLLARAKSKRVIDTDYATEDKFAHLPNPQAEKIRTRGVSAFVTVQEGCDKFCTFCVVPYTRGAENSRPVTAIVQEIAVLAQAGVREVSLLGQNVNAYHGITDQGGVQTLEGLMADIAAIEGIERIRYMTSHPRDMTDGLIKAHRNNPALMPYLHLPVQSGSDRILSAMNRQHDRSAYFKIIDQVRAARPDIALSSDFIVGFPGETDQDFRDTMDLVERIGFAQSYSFKYSARPGTPAAELGDQVPEAVKDERLQALQALLIAQQTRFNRETVGRKVSVLVEKAGRHTGQMAGKSPYLQAVQIEDARARIGDIVEVDVTGIGSNSLYAREIAAHGTAAVSERMEVSV
jgi:tRNA-2-methylthio-N6-dimethylallyladenosine synthase